MPGTRRRGHRTAVVARTCLAACVIALLAASCGLQRGQHRHQGHRGEHAAHQHASATAACAPSGIRMTLDAASAGVAAGTSYLPIDFTNVSSAECRLSGLPSVSLTSGPAAAPIGTAATTDGTATDHGAAAGLALPAGGTAHLWVHLASVANIPASQCHPVTAAGLAVSLPGQQHATFIRHQVPACARPVHGMTMLSIEPYHQGRAKPGTAQ